MRDKRPTPWIQTHTGQACDLLALDPNTLRIDDIAFALSHINRYTGHVGAYSVAQHSVLCSEQAPPGLAYAALMHDAHEAYLGDISAPVKVAIKEVSWLDGRLSPLAVLEEHLQGVMRRHFDAEGDETAIREIDLRMLQTERYQLLGPEPRSWEIDFEPYPINIIPWTPQQAARFFLNTFYTSAPVGVVQRERNHAKT